MEINDYIKGFIGPVNLEYPFAIALWANKAPRKGFIMHSTLSEICTHQKPFIVIDDYLPMALFHRSVEVQKKINDLYREMLSKESSRIEIMSSLLDPCEYFKEVVALSEKITFLEFLRCLPQKKLVNGIENIALSEVLHAAAELFVFEYIKSLGLNTIIIPHFAQAIIALHRNISSNPLNAIVTSSFLPEADFEQQSHELWSLADQVLAVVKNPAQEGV